MTTAANIAKDVGDAMAKHPGIVHGVIDALGLLGGAWGTFKAINIVETILSPVTTALGEMATAEGAAATAAGGLKTALSMIGPIAAGAAIGTATAGPVEHWMDNNSVLNSGRNAIRGLFGAKPIPLGTHGDSIWSTHENFASGGPIHGSGTKGKDSVPAWLAPGEHVLTAGEVDAMGGHSNVYAFRRALHRAGGGGIPHFDNGGAAPGSQGWLNQQLQARGLSPSEARGILAMNQVEGGASNPMSLLGFTEGQAQGPQGHLQAFMGQWNDPSRRGPGGAIPGVGPGGNVGDWNQYMAWIRERIVGQTGASSDWQGNQQPPASVYQARLMSALGGVGESNGAIGTATNPIYTTPTQERAAKADAHVKEIQEKLGELKPDAKQSERDSLNDQLGFAQQDAARARQQAEQEPTGAQRGGAGGNSTESQAQQFASGALSGLMGDLGFGNVLGGKSPLDWGIVKLATGLASWGLNMANAWADKRGSQLGLPGFAGGGGGSIGGGGPCSGTLSTLDLGCSPAVGLWRPDSAPALVVSPAPPHRQVRPATTSLPRLPLRDFPVAAAGYRYRYRLRASRHRRARAGDGD